MALWRVKQAAEYLGIRPKTLYEWVRLGRVPYRKIGFNVRFDPEELEQWTEGQSQGSGSCDTNVPRPEASNSKNQSGNVDDMSFSEKQLNESSLRSFYNLIY